MNKEHCFNCGWNRQTNQLHNDFDPECPLVVDIEHVHEYTIPTAWIDNPEDSYYKSPMVYHRVVKLRCRCGKETKL